MKNIAFCECPEGIPKLPFGIPLLFGFINNPQCFAPFGLVPYPKIPHLLSPINGAHILYFKKLFIKSLTVLATNNINKSIFPLVK